MRSRVWIVIDCSMLAAVILLQTWRLTGVPLHEWLGVALIAAIVAHLLAHWSWIETRSRRILKPKTTRTRVNFALNATLFAAMTVAMVSGFVISKVVLPAHLTPVEYLKWHGLHETSSRIMLFAAALHLALNWDVLLGGRPRIRVWARPIAVMIVAVVLVSGVTYAVEHVMSAPDITMFQNGRRIEHATPPPGITELRRDQLQPHASAWPRLIANSVAVALVTLVGRKVLRLRLD